MLLMCGYGLLVLLIQLLSFAAASSLQSIIDKRLPAVNVVYPGQPNYSNVSRAFNLRFDFSPAAVAYPTTTQEISELVLIGSAMNLHVVPRSGGHSYIANGIGGANDSLVIDLQQFQDITLDSVTGLAKIGAGNRLGTIITTLAASGRALPHGTCPYVGIGGHASYGGYGFTSRLWGLTLDTIVSLDLVLADGRTVVASKSDNADLFWAMRGSGGSFAIASSVTFQTFPVPPSVTNFLYNWHVDASTAAQILAAYQNFSLTSAPAELGGELVFRTTGTAPGNLSINLSGAWYGSSDLVNGTLATFLASVPAARTASINTGTYLQSAVRLAGGSLDVSAAPDGSDTFYAKSLTVPQNAPMSMTSMEAFTTTIANQGFNNSLTWFIQFEMYGGLNSAVNAVSEDETAYVHRNSLFTVQFYASSATKQPPYPDSGFKFLDDSAEAIIQNNLPAWPYGAYTNYIDDRLPDWQWRYYGSHYSRLLELKHLYDARGIFSFPTAIGATRDSPRLITKFLQ